MTPPLTRRLMAYGVVLALSIGLVGVFGDMFGIFRVEGMRRSVQWTGVVGILTNLMWLGAEGAMPFKAGSVMLMNGFMFGWPIGTAVSCAVAVVVSAVGFWIFRMVSTTGWTLVDASQGEKTKSFFRTYGALAVVVSRPVPILSEVCTCLAGLSPMSFPLFMTAVLVGMMPLAWLYAFVGFSMSELTSWWQAILVAGMGMAVSGCFWIITREHTVGSEEGS